MLADRFINGKPRERAAVAVNSLKHMITSNAGGYAPPVKFRRALPTGFRQRTGFSLLVFLPIAGSS
jgi:hypothetical protein